MLRFAMPVAALALVLTACADVKQAPVQDAPQTTTTKAAETSAVEDVKITKCETNGWTQTVGLEITNSSREAWKYVVGVRIKDESGATSEARFVENRIEPGKPHTEDIPGDTPLKGKITCEVEEAKRMAPQ